MVHTNITITLTKEGLDSSLALIKGTYASADITLERFFLTTFEVDEVNKAEKVMYKLLTSLSNSGKNTKSKVELPPLESVCVSETEQASPEVMNLEEKESEIFVDEINIEALPNTSYEEEGAFENDIDLQTISSLESALMLSDKVLGVDVLMPKTLDEANALIQKYS